MQSFIVPISFQFNGVVEVQAESLEDAKRDIEKYMHATQHVQNDQDNIPTDQRNITDYSFPMKWDIVFLPMTMDNINVPF